MESLSLVVLPFVNVDLFASSRIHCTQLTEGYAVRWESATVINQA